MHMVRMMTNFEDNLGQANDYAHPEKDEEYRKTLRSIAIIMLYCWLSKPFYWIKDQYVRIRSKINH